MGNVYLAVMFTGAKQGRKAAFMVGIGAGVFTGTLIIRFGAMRIAAAGLLITACHVLAALRRESFL